MDDFKRYEFAADDSIYHALGLRPAPSTNNKVALPDAEQIGLPNLSPPKPKDNQSPSLKDGVVANTPTPKADDLRQSIITSSPIQINMGGASDSDLTTTDFWRELHDEFSRLCEHEISVTDLAKPSGEIRRRVERILDNLLAQVRERMMTGQVKQISEAELMRYRELLIGYTFGLGKLDYLFRDPRGITDIAINSVLTEDDRVKLRVFVAHRNGVEEEKVDVDPEELLGIIRRQLSFSGRTLTEASPIADGRLLNGARINAVIAPAAYPYMHVSIRIPNQAASDMDFLIKSNFITVQAASFLFLCMRARLNIVIAGATGTGKTTLLNALCRLADENDRIVTIEDTKELVPGLPNAPALLTVVDNYGQTRIDQQQLVKNSLRMFPTRIIMGEARDGAAWNAIHAASTGHNGLLMTFHADDEESIFETLARLCEMSRVPLSNESLMKLLAKTIQIAIHIRRYRPHKNSGYVRHIASILESNGLYRDGRINLQPYFKYVNGALVWQNYLPHKTIMNRFEDAGITMDMIKTALSSEVPVWHLDEFKNLTC